MLSTDPMRSSMRSTASFAPPCSGPYSAPTAPVQEGSHISPQFNTEARLQVPLRALTSLVQHLAASLQQDLRYPDPAVEGCKRPDAS